MCIRDSPSISVVAIQSRHEKIAPRQVTWMDRLRLTIQITPHSQTAAPIRRRRSSHGPDRSPTTKSGFLFSEPILLVGPGAIDARQLPILQGCVDPAASIADG